MAEIEISGRMAVKTLKKQMKVAYGVTLRVYNGNRFADEDATLASIRKGDAKGGVVTVNGHMLVGDFEKAIMENYGIKIQIANGDDSKLSDNNISLSAAGESIRNAEKMEKKNVVSTDEKTDSVSLLNAGKKVFGKNNRRKFIEGEFVIPDGFTEIGERAFYGCSSLTSVSIPDSVTEIKSEAFRGCSSLTSVSIPDSVTEIGSGAFYGCSSLTSVSIPDSVTEIGGGAFDDCPLPPGLLLYANGTKCYGWKGDREECVSVSIPDSVTEIGSYAFYGCSSLTSVSIPDSVTKIGSYAFYDCPLPPGLLLYANGTKCYGWKGDCEECVSVSIPDSVTEIGSYAFEYCESLTSVSIPDSVTEIGERAFYGCSSLTSVSIPDSVTKIGYGAFSGCDSLRKMVWPDSLDDDDKKKVIAVR